jgi:twinkle protein
VGYHVKKPVHLPDSGFSNEDILKSYKELTKEEDRVHVYGHFGSDDPDIILDIIRHLVVVSGCKFVFLDHITMLVTGFEDEDERKKLDYISTKLAMMTRELNFTLFLISHVNDDGKTRGSRNIAKVADLIVALDRDIEHADPEIRNTTNITVKGNRFSGRSGPACPLFFSTESYTLSEKVLEETQMESIKQRNF